MGYPTPKRRQQHDRAHKVQMLEYALKYQQTARGKFVQLKSSAKRRGLEMVLTLEQYEGVVSVGVCHFCGHALPKYGHGLDRLDRRLGYVLGNVVPCCGPCNTVKGNLEAAGFVYPRTVELVRELIRARF